MFPSWTASELFWLQNWRPYKLSTNPIYDIIKSACTRKSANRLYLDTFCDENVEIKAENIL